MWVCKHTCVCACVVVGSYSNTNRNSLKNRGAIQPLLLLFFIFVMLSATAAVCLDHTASFCRCGSHGITVAVLARYTFYDSYELCFCVCVCAHYVCVPSSTHVHEEQITTRTSSELQKHPRSTYSSGTTATAAVNASESRNAQLHRNACSPFSTCNTPGIWSQPHPPGEPVPYHISYHGVFNYDTDLYNVVAKGRY